MNTSTRTRTVFDRVDALDAQGFAQFFAADGRLTFGNGPTMVGPDQIVAGCSGFFDTIAGMRHSVVNEWQVGDQTIVELKVTYTRQDGGDVDLPVVSIWASDTAGLITDYRVYFDVAPVFAESGAVTV